MDAVDSQEQSRSSQLTGISRGHHKTAAIFAIYGGGCFGVLIWPQAKLSFKGRQPQGVVCPQQH